MRDVEEIAFRYGLGLKSDIIVGAFSVVDAIVGYAETVSAGSHSRRNTGQNSLKQENGKCSERTRGVRELRSSCRAIDSL